MILPFKPGNRIYFLKEIGKKSYIRSATIQQVRVTYLSTLEKTWKLNKYVDKPVDKIIELKIVTKEYGQFIYQPGQPINFFRSKFELTSSTQYKNNML